MSADQVTVEIHPDSHTDHAIAPDVLAAALRAHEAEIAAGQLGGVVVGTYRIEGASVPSQIVKREPGETVLYGVRGTRAGATPLVDRGGAWTDEVTVISGPHAGEEHVLYTCHGGPCAPREPWDQGLCGERDASEAGASAWEESVAFWAAHALALRAPARACSRCGDVEAGDWRWPWAGVRDVEARAREGVGECGDLHAWIGEPVLAPLGPVVVNLTPHEVRVGSRRLPPSGVVARVAMESADAGAFAGVALATQRAGDVEGLPRSAPGVLWVVSGMVRSALGDDRLDLASPGDLVRDSEGRVIGCNGLVLTRPEGTTERGRVEDCVCGLPVWEVCRDLGYGVGNYEIVRKCVSCGELDEVCS